MTLAIFQKWRITGAVVSGLKQNLLAVRLLVSFFAMLIAGQIHASDFLNLARDSSVTRIENFFRSSLEQKGLRALAWNLNVLGDEGLSADYWRQLVFKETGQQKLVIEVDLGLKETEAANALLKRVGINDFIEIVPPQLERMGPRKASVAENELGQIESVKFYGQLGAGAGAFLMASLLGYLSLSEIQTDGTVARMTMSIHEGPTWKKLAPYLSAGLVSFGYHLISGKIKDFWGQRLSSPNRFWSRFLIDDALLPLLAISISSIVALFPPAVVEYHGMSVNSFAAIVLSAVSLNLFQSAIKRGVDNGELNRISSEKHIAFWSVYTGVARSWVINSGAALGGVLMQLGMMAFVAGPAWLKVTKLNEVFDRETGLKLKGQTSRLPRFCSSFLRVMARPRQF